MEKKKGTETTRWDEVNGCVQVEEKPVVQELPGFDSKKNPMRSIEDMIEQNDNQLDGVINNLPEETVAEKEAKTSVVEKLKSIVVDPHDKDERKPIPCPGRELC